jgi:dipeptidyl aminopeptidase/acylaminoacyl peptidase
MHSENDLRCPIEQAEQLYVALRLLGNTDTVFVRFPEENHELTRSGKPSRRVERFQILLDWFDHYLQNDGRVDAAGVRSAGLRAAMGAAKTEANR